ncbi:UNVERIFIED_CONTAM: hypothetical protein H355_002504 [Colinus virginianus]|nr:hypothetical protein H355_002504 [Colinus virginianus]
MGWSVPQFPLGRSMSPRERRHHLTVSPFHSLCPAQVRVVAPSVRVTAVVGQDVVLHCQLSPCKDAWSSDVRWIQLRSSGLVHHYQNGVDLGQMEEYKGRTELLRSGLSDGNLDLRITALSSSDSGSYSCAVQDEDGYGEAAVTLEGHVVWWHLQVSLICVSQPHLCPSSSPQPSVDAEGQRPLKESRAELLQEMLELELVHAVIWGGSAWIVYPWIVAVAVVSTLLVVSFVIIVFHSRNRVAQSRELSECFQCFYHQSPFNGLDRMEGGIVCWEHVMFGAMGCVGAIGFTGVMGRVSPD